MLARAAYLGNMPVIREAGADEVFSGEGKVALAMTEHIRECVRVRAELFRGSNASGGKD